MKAVYNSKDNTLIEQPGMDEPEEPMAICYVQDDRGYERAMRHYRIELAEYKDHVQQLRVIRCAKICKRYFKDQATIEEGADYKVCDSNDGGIMAFPILPVKSEDDVPNLILTAFQNEPVNFLLSNALRHLTQDQQRQLCNALLERLPSPADLEQEAERLYPYSLNDKGAYIDNEFNYIQKQKRSAHITAARQYMGEIDALTRENHKLMAENDTLSEELGELKNITDGLDARVINQKADLLIAYRNKIALTPGITVETILAMLEDDIKTLRAMGGAEIVKSIIHPSNDKS